LAGVVLIHDHSQRRRKCDDQGGESAEPVSHPAMIALTLQRVVCFCPEAEGKWPILLRGATRILADVLGC
jgi:hypothetical protein